MLVFEIDNEVTTPEEDRELVSRAARLMALSPDYSIRHATAGSYISSRGDFHMMSAGSIASEPYTKKKGVCPVALLG